MLAITTCLSSLDSLGVHRNERKTFQNISAELSRKQLFILSCVSVSVLKSVSADKNISFNNRFIRPWDTRFPTHKGRKYVIITSIRRLTRLRRLIFSQPILIFAYYSWNWNNKYFHTSRSSLENHTRLYTRFQTTIPFGEAHNYLREYPPPRVTAILTLLSDILLQFKKSVNILYAKYLKNSSAAAQDIKVVALKKLSRTKMSYVFKRNLWFKFDSSLGIMCGRIKGIIIRRKLFFLFIGRELTTWPANNCLQIIVCSCAMPSNSVWMQIIFCSCVKEQCFSPSCDRSRVKVADRFSLPKDIH